MHCLFHWLLFVQWNLSPNSSKLRNRDFPPDEQMHCLHFNFLFFAKWKMSPHGLRHSQRRNTMCKMPKRVRTQRQFSLQDIPLHDLRRQHPILRHLQHQLFFEFQHLHKIPRLRNHGNRNCLSDLFRQLHKNRRAVSSKSMYRIKRRQVHPVQGRIQHHFQWVLQGQ